MNYWATEYLKIGSAPNQKTADYYDQQDPERHGSSGVLPAMAGLGAGALGAWGLSHTDLGQHLSTALDHGAHQLGIISSQGIHQAGDILHKGSNSTDQWLRHHTVSVDPVQQAQEAAAKSVSSGLPFDTSLIPVDPIQKALEDNVN